MRHILTAHISVTAELILIKLETQNYHQKTTHLAKLYLDQWHGWSRWIPSLPLFGFALFQRVSILHDTKCNIESIMTAMSIAVNIMHQMIGLSHHSIYSNCLPEGGQHTFWPTVQGMIHLFTSCSILRTLIKTRYITSSSLQFLPLYPTLGSCFLFLFECYLFSVWPIHISDKYIC